MGYYLRWYSNTRGTLAGLKGYIENNKGKVLGSYALTGKQYSVQLRLSKETLTELRGKYGELEKWWTKEFGYDFSKLTEWEAKFIINSRKTPDEVRNTIIARKQGWGISSYDDFKLIQWNETGI